MQGLELIVVDEYILNKLSLPSPLSGLGVAGDSIVEVYSDTIPTDVKFPYVIFQMQSNLDTMVTEGIRVLNVATYIVKAVGRTESYADLASLASQIDVRLHKASGVVADGSVLHSRRVQVIRYPQVTEAVSYRHLGGSYRFWTQATT